MVKATVVGASGYMGGELLRLLVRHPEIEEIVSVSRSYAGKPVSSLHKNLYKVLDLPFVDLDLDNIDSDIVFFAAPHADWFAQVPSLLNRGLKVITLGGKFRIQDPVLDHRVYGGYEDPSLLEERVYGLPELYREDIKKARFVTNPGCYPTSILLGALPLKGLVLEDKIDFEKIVATSISGTSGAGAKPSVSLHHPEMCDNIRPYNIFFHRHRPEIEFILKDTFKKEVNVFFTPSIANMPRGIISYVTLFSSEVDIDLTKYFTAFYKGEPFVRIICGDDENVPGILEVVGTNYCDIGVNLDESSGRILILSAVDNLIKGGSGQAVQNMNIMLGFNETTGLDLVCGHP